MDIYDNTEALERLLDIVTEYMIDIIGHCKNIISQDNEWFYDWGILWKGFARISNCSMQMISPEMYKKHILSRDIRFFQAFNGGRMHYCGINRDVIGEFMKVPLITGLDFDCNHHDFFDLCEKSPSNLVLRTSGLNVKSQTFY